MQSHYGPSPVIHMVTAIRSLSQNPVSRPPPPSSVPLPPVEFPWPPSAHLTEQSKQWYGLPVCG